MRLKNILFIVGDIEESVRFYNIRIYSDYRSYDKENRKPVIKARICNGEQVAGFKDIHAGKIEEAMLIKSPVDREYFKAMYGIDEEIAKEY